MSSKRARQISIFATCHMALSVLLGALAFWLFDFRLDGPDLHPTIMIPALFLSMIGLVLLFPVGYFAFFVEFGSKTAVACAIGSLILNSYLWGFVVVCFFGVGNRASDSAVAGRGRKPQGIHSDSNTPDG